MLVDSISFLEVWPVVQDSTSLHTSTHHTPTQAGGVLEVWPVVQDSTTHPGRGGGGGQG